MKNLILFLVFFLPLSLLAQKHVELYNKGVEAHQKNDIATALKYYNECLALEKTYVHAIHNRALIYFNQQNYDQAIADCTMGIEADPKYVFFYNTRGNCLKNQQRYKEAIADFSTEIAIATENKDKATAYFNRAWCYDKLLNNKKKLADFEKAVELEPNNATYQYDCGRAKFDVGGDVYKSAIDNFSKVIELEPKNKDAYAERATYYMTHQDFKRALKDLDVAKKLGADVDHLIEAAKFELEMMEGN